MSGLFWNTYSHPSLKKKIMKWNFEDFEMSKMKKKERDGDQIW